jgi:hypothetical protein
VYQLVLDAAVMLVANFVLAGLHPGLTLGAGRDIPTRKQRKAEREMIARAKADGTWSERGLLHGSGDVEAGTAYKGGIPLHSPSPSTAGYDSSYHSVNQEGHVYVPRH